MKTRLSLMTVLLMTLPIWGADTLPFSEILLVQRHMIRSSHVYTYHEEDNKPGGGLYVFNVETQELREILNSDQGLILDATLHYDGRTVLFSWKREMSGKFQLYTINIDGTDLKQITTHPSNNFNASWLPTNEMVFLSDRKPAFAYCWQTTTPILFKCRTNGSKVTRLSANYLNDFTPSVMTDGRILYSRWEYVDRPAIPIQSLWSINSDGTGLAGVFGNRALSPATFMDAREIPDSGGKILCVLTAHNRHCHGAIGIVDPKIGGNAKEAIRNLTPEVNIGYVDKGDGNHIRGPYVNPFPLDEKRYLVSKDGTIQIRDYENKDIQELLVGSAKELGFYSPQPIRQRGKERFYASPLPAGTDTSKELENEWAEVTMTDIYNGLPDSIERGSIKKLAIIQEMEKPLGIDPGQRAFGFQFPVVSAGATYAPKKVWGYATVEEDGSAYFKVPARQPIYFLPLDEEGMAVQRMRTFTHFMPGERQSCIGCHANRNYATVDQHRRPEAMKRGVEEPQIPEWGVKGFSYPKLVQPIWDQHCVDCHGRDNPEGGLELTGDKTDFFNVSYENLVRKGNPSENYLQGGFREAFHYPYVKWIPTYNGQEANILQVDPGYWGAKSSALAKVIQSGHKDADGKPRVNLTALEKHKLYLWMDLNVPYYESSNSNYQQNRGCRQQLPPGFVNTFKDMTKRRCIECHTQKGNDQFYTYPNQFALRIDHPERNPIFTAPLAKEAGGGGKCGVNVFANRQDEDYQKLISTFETLANNLEKRPRLDMMESDCNACTVTETRKYLVGDYCNGRISVFSERFGSLWSYPVAGVYDCWMRDNGNIVAAGYDQVIEVKPHYDAGHGGTVVWTYKAGSAYNDFDGKSEVHGCQLLTNGNTLITEAGIPRLIEIDPRGKLVRTIPLPKTTQNVHNQLRMARIAQEGNYWVSYLGDGIIYKVDSQGNTLNQIKVKSAYEAIPLLNGNILTSGAGAGNVAEYDTEGNIVWELGKNDLPGISLNWIAGIERLPNNNIIICDWGRGKSTVKALEVTPDKQVIWQLNHPHFKGITRIQTLLP